MQPLVLIVDDDAWIRSVTSELLTHEGFGVLEAPDGPTGLQLAEAEGPDLVLLDLALPGHSGMDVLRTLKERQPTREIPVIVVSAYALLYVGDDLWRADGVLHKPFDLGELLAKVREATTQTAQS